MGRKRLIDESEIMKNETKTRILCLYNIVTSNELENDEEFEEIKEDIEDECMKFGEVIQVVIPRPEHDRIPTNILNDCRIYVEFKTEEDSYAAQQGLSGRQFNDNIVIIQYFSVEKFKEEICQQNS
ncbi:hypothetical protein SNEBB_007333 [Seison nebaliae]|nr:hypothetical protein SNEBB_007333 [Seison nebaliae]